MQILEGANPETVDQMYNKILFLDYHLLIKAILDSERIS